MAYAQTVDPDSLPGPADPGRILEHQAPSVKPLKKLERQEDTAQAVPQIPPEAESIRFTLRTMTFEGMTAYDPVEIEALYKPYINREVSVATLFEIMGRLQQKYLDDGYTLTRVYIPNQTIESGQARLVVVEGYVDVVDLDPALPPSTVLQDAVSRIRSMRPLNTRDLERLMLIVNDLPDSNIGAVLRRSENAKAGAVNVFLKKDKSEKMSGSLSADNYGSIFSGPYEVKTHASVFHVGPYFSELNITALSAIPSEEQILGNASYSLPLFGASGTKLSLSTSQSYTVPGASLRELEFMGKSKSLSAALSYPVIRQRDMSLIIDAGAEIKYSRTKLLGEEFFDDRLRILKAGANFNILDPWSGYSVADAHVFRGLDLMGIRPAGSVNLSRAEGEPVFTKMELTLGRIQSFPHNFELITMMNGQYSFEPLLSSEEFGFGGGQIGRGYDPSEISGDHGFSGSVELRYTHAIPAKSNNLVVQPYLFYDIGKIWNIDPETKNRLSAASAGGGVRLNYGQSWSCNFTVAHPLTKEPDNGPKYQEQLGPRLLFSMTKEF